MYLHNGHFTLQKFVVKLSTWLPGADESQEVHNRLSPQRFKGLNPNRWAEGRQKNCSSLVPTNLFLNFIYLS